MKIKIELDESCQDVEVVIRTAHLGQDIEQIQAALAQLERQPLIFYKGTSD